MKFSTTLFAAITTSIVALSACTESRHHHVEDVVATTRLTLIHQDGDVIAKLSGIESRSLITDYDLTQPLQFLAIDPNYTDFHLISPNPSKIPGLYRFPAPKTASGGYRIWADVKPNVALSKKQLEEFPFADLGARRIGSIAKVDMLEASMGGHRFTLTFDSPLAEDEESIGTLHIDGKATGASGEIIGFYDDFRTVARIKLDNTLTFHLIPSQGGYVKFFALVKLDGKTVTVPFGANVAKAK